MKNGNRSNYLLLLNDIKHNIFPSRKHSCSLLIRTASYTFTITSSTAFHLTIYSSREYEPAKNIYLIIIS